MESAICAKKEFDDDDDDDDDDSDDDKYDNDKFGDQLCVVMNNRSNYDQFFVIKELSEEFEGKFECLEENVEKYITFSVSIDKKNWK